MKDTILMLVESMKKVKGIDVYGENNYIYDYLKSCIYDYYVTSEECVSEICIMLLSLHFEKDNVDVIEELEKISILNGKLISNLENSKTLYNHIEKYMYKCFNNMYDLFSDKDSNDIKFVLDKYKTLSDFIGMEISYD